MQLKTFQQPWLNRILLFIWVAISSWLFFSPSDKIPDDVANLNDKIGHAAVFMLAVIFAKFTFKRVSYKSLVAVFVLYGFLVEAIQWMLPVWFHRGFDLLDFMADSVGVLVGTWLLSKFLKVRQH